MKRVWCILLAVLLALSCLLCVGCVQQPESQQEQEEQKESGAAEWLAAVDVETLGSLNPATYPLVKAGDVVQAMKATATHEITEEEALASGYGRVLWQLWTETYVQMECSMAEPIVHVMTPQGSGYFRSQTLYDLVRHSRDYMEIVDKDAYARFQTQLDAVMQQTLDNYAAMPGAFTSYTLTRFNHVWQYETEDGNRAELYKFNFALTPEKPEEDFWAGGIYMDSQLRVQGHSSCGNVVARYQGDTLLGLVFMGSDNSYVPAFEEDQAWAEAMLAAMEQPETTTETFTFDSPKLTVEVSNVVLIKKGTVMEDENSSFENDVFVVLPGAVVTVKEAAAFADSDGVEHGEWIFSSLTQDSVEVLSGMEFTIEPEGNSFSKESFPVLAFQVYES